MKTSAKLGIIGALLLVVLFVAFVEVDTDKIAEIQEKNAQDSEAKKARAWLIEQQYQHSMPTVIRGNERTLEAYPELLERAKTQVREEVTAMFDQLTDEQVIKVAYDAGWRP